MWSLLKFRVIYIQLMLNSLVCIFSGLFLDPFLNSGVMFAFFHSEGTIPSSSDKLNNFASGAQQFP